VLDRASQHCSDEIFQDHAAFRAIFYSFKKPVSSTRNGKQDTPNASTSTSTEFSEAVGAGVY
jgi:hypothetical protein